MVRARLAFLPSLAVVLLTAAPAYPQQRDTLETGSGTFGAPVIAALAFVGDIIPTSPLFGLDHVAWTRDLALRHAWKAFGPWQTEVVADTAVSYDIGVNGDGLATLAYSDSSGRLVFAERTSNGWVRDTVVQVPGAQMRISVAPRGEPAIAWEEFFPPDGFGRLRYARRAGGSWTITEVDTSLTNMVPSLVVGSDGRPRIAAVPWENTLILTAVCVYEGAGPTGPFDRAIIDSAGAGPVSIAWDDVHQRPLVAYGARRLGDSDLHPDYRLAWRDAASVWHEQEMAFSNFLNFRSVAIALDPVGTVGVLWYDEGFQTTNLARQPAGVPSMPFDPAIPVSAPFADSWLFTNSALASHQYGRFDLCWRSPRFTAPVSAIVYREIDPVTTAVPEPAVPASTRLDLSPTPRRAGDPVLLRWSQPRAAEARLTAYDLAGRVVMSHSAGRLPAGEHEFRWTPSDLVPGVYWVSLQFDGRPVARRVLVSR